MVITQLVLLALKRVVLPTVLWVLHVTTNYFHSIVT